MLYSSIDTTKRIGYMVEIMWHHRETRRQTEKTNSNLEYREKPVYSTQKKRKRSKSNGIKTRNGGNKIW